MRIRSIVGLGAFCCVTLATVVAAQSPGRVVKMDPSLDALIPESATIEKVAGGFGFAEGPVWSRDGALLFSDIPGKTIHRIKDGQVSIFRTPLFEGKEFRPGFHIGSNGLTIDRQGRVLIAEHGNRRVSRLDSNGQLTVLADRYEGKRLNSPNDIVVKSDGAIYFTDPPYGLPGQDTDPQPLWYGPSRSVGALALEQALGRIEAPEVPANVAFGEGGKTLFLTARTSVYRVRLNTAGKLP